MKHLKSYENLKSNTNYLICKLTFPEKFVGNIHLLKVIKIIEKNNSYLVSALEPSSSRSFFIYYENNKYITEYGFKYDILYETNDKKEAYKKYNLLIDTSNYNL